MAGVDEVGRGPLAGPVMAAAVILPDDFEAGRLTDSKKLSAKRRESEADRIRSHPGVVWSIARVEAAEIDELNIHRATLLAMARAAEGLDRAPDHLLVDGTHTPNGPWTAEAIIKGDGSVLAISAASVIAKVARDRWMSELHEQYPDYGFDCHAGYPTKDHMEALGAIGPCPEHRRSYRPVQRAISGRR
ncbi:MULTISPECIES: ribonuclease HII [unclassified Thioalkalivibrio]|uniref:ribonuclease HII n=1 Tax=unclassified Thioalkalivibrio TaxID=2621013 RepID=UPI00037DE233